MQVSNRYIYTNCIITSAHSLVGGGKDYVMNRAFNGDISNKLLMFAVKNIEVIK